MSGTPSNRRAIGSVAACRVDGVMEERRFSMPFRETWLGHKPRPRIYHSRMENPSLRIIDSHTGGEPTRVVISGGTGPRRGHDGGEGGNPPARSRLAAGFGLQRTARARGDGRCLVVRSAGAGLPLRRDILQQRLQPRHVHPRHHRRDDHSRAHGPDRPRGRIVWTRPSAW